MKVPNFVTRIREKRKAKREKRIELLTLAIAHKNRANINRKATQGFNNELSRASFGNLDMLKANEIRDPVTQADLNNARNFARDYPGRFRRLFSSWARKNHRELKPYIREAKKRLEEKQKRVEKEKQQH